MDFVPIVLTTSGGMGEQLQRRYWNLNPHWIRVAEEDEAMKIGPWVASLRKPERKAFWEARFAVAVANCNAGMISRSQHITNLGRLPLRVFSLAIGKYAFQKNITD